MKTKRARKSDSITLTKRVLDNKLSKAHCKGYCTGATCSFTHLLRGIEDSEVIVKAYLIMVSLNGEGSIIETFGELVDHSDDENPLQLVDKLIWALKEETDTFKEEINMNWFVDGFEEIKKEFKQFQYE